VATGHAHSHVLLSEPPEDAAMAAPESGADEKPSSATFGRFAGRGRTVIVLALEEARMLNHDSIGTEHILLGLLRGGEGIAAQALESLGIDLEAVRQQVVEITGRGEQAPPEHIPFTGRAKKVLELSLREAMQLGHNYIGTEHILLGLIREDDGVAAQILVKLGANPSQVRHQVIQLVAAVPVARVTSAGGTEFRLSAVEQRAGIAPDTADLDRQIRQVRTDKGAAAAAEDYERAASLRDRERELLADKASRQQQWAAGHPDMPSLAEVAEQVRQLSEAIGQLGGLLRQPGRTPDEGTA
jgi:Clp amino terminal domain, pathogenicity island component/UvrB/uvrC motif